MSKVRLSGEELAGLRLRALYSEAGYTQYRMSKFEEYDLYGDLPVLSGPRPKMANRPASPAPGGAAMAPQMQARERRKQGILESMRRRAHRDDIKTDHTPPTVDAFAAPPHEQEAAYDEAPEFSEQHESALNERIRHLTDTFSEYLIYLIDSKHLSYPDVYKRAIVDKKVFSKIKNNPDAHPKKMTVMCLCVGAMLNLDETRDLMARAGYALSPCDKTDIIFSYFIENGIYDMIELDIQLEEHGLPCLIS